jgi:biopolymer transport protein ExbD
MSTMTPLQRRAAHKSRHKTGLDMNLVSLIDIFTLLIFFLLSNAGEVEMLPPSKAVKLPESSAEKHARETIVVVVNNDDILVQGRRVAKVSEAMAMAEDVIPGLKAELDIQAQRQPVRVENKATVDKGLPVTIMGDKEIPYRLLRKVMVTCARATFTDVAFAVNRRVDA